MPQSTPLSPPAALAADKSAWKAFESTLTLIHIHAGDYKVASDPGVMLTTILGSCVSACVLDPTTGLGGMNHFLLPTQKEMQDAGPRERYGDFAMRALLDTLYAMGARKAALQAKLYGGAKVIVGATNIGAMNADFARHFLREEGVRIIGESLGGEHGRRVKFHPASGQIREEFVQSRHTQIVWPQLIPAPKIAPLRPISIP